MAALRTDQNGNVSAGRRSSQPRKPSLGFVEQEDPFADDDLITPNLVQGTVH